MPTITNSIFFLALLGLPLSAQTALNTVTVPQQVYLLGSPINTTGTNGHHPQYSPDGTSLAWGQTRPGAGGAYDVVVANADGSSPVIITQTTFAKAHLPKSGSGTCGNPTWAPDSAGLIIACQSATSALTFAQANPGAGSDDSLWYIDKAGASKILELAGDIPCTTSAVACISGSHTQGGFLQHRISVNPGTDGNYFLFVGHDYSWNCSSTIGGLCQRLEKFDYTQTAGTPALSGTGVNNGIEGNALFIATSAAPATGSGACTAQATGGAGLAAVGTIPYSGAAWGQLAITLNGNSYTSPPTSWTLTGGAACTAVSPLTTTGGALSGTAYNVCLTSPTNCFIEGGATDPAENPAHTMYISQFTSTLSQGLIYKFDLSNTGAGEVLIGPSTGWNEMPTFTPFFGTLCFDSSNATPDIPVQGNTISLDLYCQPPGASFYGATFFNTPGNPMYYSAGGKFVSFGVYSFSTDYKHVAAEIFDNTTFANVYILPVGPQTSQSFGQVNSISKVTVH